jgi:hypothetical protein
VPEDARLYLLALALLGALIGLLLLQGLHRQSAHASTGVPRAAAPAPALPPATPEDELIGRVATSVAARPVRVSCTLDSRTDGDLTELGEARTVPGSRTAGVVLLAPSVCTDLLGFTHGLVASDWSCVDQNGPNLCSDTVDHEILALHTLAHETWHIRGISNEAATDCYALQSVSTVARTLGTDPVDAQALSAYYAAHFDAIRRPPPNYRSADCRDGGKLDLHPGSGVWPG